VTSRPVRGLVGPATSGRLGVRSPAVFGTILVLYVLLAESAYELFGALTIGVTFFPPAGLTFAAFLVLPRRHWPAIATAIVVGEVVVDMGQGNGFWWSLGWAGANLSEPFVGALVAHHFRPEIDVSRRTAVAIVIGGLVVGPTIGASIGATVLDVANDLDWWSSFQDVWVGDALGVLVMAPVFLMVGRWLQPPGRSLRWGFVRARDVWLMAVALAATGVGFFAFDNIALGYAFIPLLAWPAIRAGPQGLAVAAVALASISTAATARDHGPWSALEGEDAQAELGHQQLFLLAAIGGAWLLTFEVRERVRATEIARSVASDAALLSRAFDVEQTARERADLLARVNAAVGQTLDIGELVERITAAAVPALGEWCSLVLTLDETGEDAITSVAHSDPEKALWAKRYQEQFPFDAGGRGPTAEVLRHGVTLFVPVIDPAMFDVLESEEQREVLRSLDVRSTIVVAIPSQLGPLGLLELVRTSATSPFAEADVEVAEEVAKAIGAALNNAVLYQRQLRSRAALDALQRLTGELAASVTRNEIAQTVVDRGTSSVSATACMLYVIEGDDSLRLVGQKGLGKDEAERWRVLDRNSRGPIADAVRSRSTIVLRGSAEIRERYPTMFAPPLDETSLVALPLIIRNTAIGGLAFTFDHPRRITHEELAMLETLAGRCAGALERARLYDEQRTASLTLQRRLLPELPDLPPWLEAGASYLPASGGEVGGDWYQLLVLDEGRCAAALGDAVGRGVPAAAAMGQLRAVITGAAGVNPDPATVIAATDGFAASGADTQCTSAVYCLFERDGHRVNYLSAGHPPPLLLRSSGEAMFLWGGRRWLLGTSGEQSTTPAATEAFHPGDALILYSDGLVERRGEALDDGLERLRQLAATLLDHSPSAMCEAMVHALVADPDVPDDVAVLVLRRAGVT
jgi:integral membrane sensor domain MASE1/GAF domain-containing protein